MKLKLTKIWHFAILLTGLIIADPFIHRLGEKIMGFTGMFIAAFVMAVSFFILAAMWMSFVTGKKEIPRYEKNAESLMSNTSSQKSQFKQKKVWQKMNNGVKISLVLGIIIFIITCIIIYYFYIKQKNEKKIYNECVAEVNKNLNINRMPLAVPLQKSKIDACVKAGGVENYNKNKIKNPFLPFDVTAPTSKDKQSK